MPSKLFRMRERVGQYLVFFLSSKSENDAAPARCEQMTYAMTSSTRDSTDGEKPESKQIFQQQLFRNFSTAQHFVKTDRREAPGWSLSGVCHDYLSGYTCTLHVSVRPCTPVSTETGMKWVEGHAGICVLLWIPDSCVCVCTFVREVPCYPPELLIKGVSSVSVTELKAEERNYSILN